MQETVLQLHTSLWVIRDLTIAKGEFTKIPKQVRDLGYHTVVNGQTLVVKDSTLPNLQPIWASMPMIPFPGLCLERS